MAGEGSDSGVISAHGLGNVLNGLSMVADGDVVATAVPALKSSKPHLPSSRTNVLLAFRGRFVR